MASVSHRGVFATGDPGIGPEGPPGPDGPAGPTGPQGIVGPPSGATIGSAVTDFGATGNGSTNDYAALAATLTAAAGKTVIVPPGTYRFDTTLAIPASTVVVLAAGATLQCRVTGGVAGITLADHSRLYAESSGANPAQVIAHSSCNVSALITNLLQDGTQEYAFIEGLTISAQGGAVIGVALVNLVSLFVNSAIRHCTILCNSVAKTGLRIAGGSSVGCGPVVAEDIWITHGTEHNLVVAENNPQTGHCSVWLNEITCEHQADGFYGIYMVGFGGLRNVKIRNYHYESNISATTTTGAIYAEFIVGLLVDGAEILSAPISNKVGITLVNCYLAQVENVVNVNNVNPVLTDSQHSVTIPATHVDFYRASNTGGNSTQQFRHRVNFTDGLTTKVKAGAIADGDFSGTPPDGTVGIDTTNSRVYVRVGGVWKSVVVA